MNLLALLTFVLHLLHLPAPAGGSHGYAVSPAPQAASAPVRPDTTSALDPTG